MISSEVSDTLSPELTGYIIRAADDGVPIGSLKRIFKSDPAALRLCLHDAVERGQLIEMPREDWPPGTPASKRAPVVQAPRHVTVSDDEEMIMRFAQAFRTTPLEGHVLLVLLRKTYATITMLHNAIEESRGNPVEPTQIKIVHVVICNLRKKVGKYGLTIRTLHSIGYDMAVADRHKALDMIKGNGDVEDTGGCLNAIAPGVAGGSPILGRFQ